MNIDSVKYFIDQEVFFKLNTEKHGIITAILFEKTGISYRVTWNDFEIRWHSESEIVKEKVFKND